MWCYVDELSMRHVDGGWVVVDLFFEAGLGYMRDHLQAGGEPAVDEEFTFGKGFRWDRGSRRCDGATPPASSQPTRSRRSTSSPAGSGTADPATAIFGREAVRRVLALVAAR